MRYVKVKIADKVLKKDGSHCVVDEIVPVRQLVMHSDSVRIRADAGWLEEATEAAYNAQGVPAPPEYQLMANATLVGKPDEAKDDEEAPAPIPQAPPPPPPPPKTPVPPPPPPPVDAGTGDTLRNGKNMDQWWDAAESPGSGKRICPVNPDHIHRTKLDLFLCCKEISITG